MLFFQSSLHGLISLNGLQSLKFLQKLSSSFFRFGFDVYADEFAPFAILFFELFATKRGDCLIS